MEAALVHTFWQSGDPGTGTKHISNLGIVAEGETLVVVELGDNVGCFVGEEVGELPFYLPLQIGDAGLSLDN